MWQENHDTAKHPGSPTLTDGFQHPESLENLTTAAKVTSFRNAPVPDKCPNVLYMCNKETDQHITFLFPSDFPSSKCVNC